MLPLITIWSGLFHIERSTVISCSVSLQIIMASKIQVQIENRKYMGWICKEKSAFPTTLTLLPVIFGSQEKTEGNNIPKSVRSVICTLLLLIHKQSVKMFLNPYNVLLSIQRTGRSLSIQYLQGFPWWSVVKTPNFHCRALRFNP